MEQSGLCIENLDFGYTQNLIYDHAELKLTTNGVYGFVGPNGSGKSTLFNLITGLLPAKSGHMTLDDKALTPRRVFEQVAFVQDSAVLYPYLTVRDHIQFVSRQHDVTAEKVTGLCQQLEITSELDRRIDTLSLGQKQRVMITLALIPNSRLLLMDEPLNGLDPDSVVIIRQLLQALGSGSQIVIVSSHNLDELDKITHRLIFKVDQGLFLAETGRSAEAQYEQLFRQKGVEHA